MGKVDSFGSHGVLPVGEREYRIARLSALAGAGYDVTRLPYSLKVLLENLLRAEDGETVTRGDIESLAGWDAAAEPNCEIAFMPARVLLQDFTGVPAVVDFAAMREAVARLGGDPRRINPLHPAELVIDHSIQVDEFGTPLAIRTNAEMEYRRNGERYAFLRWGQQAFDNFRVVPPETGICHQVNLEYLARVVFGGDGGDQGWAYPDTLVGTDSHTTMVNGLGVLGWGVGGIEAEAAMLGQPISMLIPKVVGFKLYGELREGATATDLVLTVTQLLRRHGVVGKFVEFYGPGLEHLPVADRATIGNMSPEYGATCGIFPIDDETLRYLAFTGRSPEHVALVEAYAREQGLFHDEHSPEPVYSEHIELDLGTVEPSMAGPKRPQDRVPLGQVAAAFGEALATTLLPPARRAAAGSVTPAQVNCTVEGEEITLRDGSVVIAAITSCTNTSNPSVMIAAGLLAKKAAERGLNRRPWVKTSLAPGSKVVTEYYRAAGLDRYLDQLGFQTVGYGCTTCIGNSGPLPPEISAAVEDGSLVVTAVLSGNRNFEGRINPDVRANYLASPPLVVAYALAGRIDWDPYAEPIGTDRDGRPVYLRDIWPSRAEVEQVIASAVRSEMFTRVYADVFTGDERWRTLPVPAGDLYAWDPASTYVRQPPYFEDMPATPPEVEDIRGARVLALLGDSITTDHISPAGSIRKDSPAGRYLLEHGVEVRDFNTYGARRGNHEVMMRGTFANIRLRNRMTPEVEGGYTRLLPEGAVTSIYDAAMEYQRRGTPMVVIAGAEYGTGSSRDWAAKGPRLLGVRAVIAESFERIHRSNLVGMGVLPLQFSPGESAETLGIRGDEVFDVLGVAEALARPRGEPRSVRVHATRPDSSTFEFVTLARLDTPQEAEYFRHGGILHFMLRQLLQGTEVESVG